MYPSTKDAPSGKLRLLYEGNPMAFIMEQAGGRTFNGTSSILDQMPVSLHGRCPVFMGSHDDVLDVENLYKKHGLVGK